MTLDLLHRIRWANVARAAAIGLALLLALAWPRLRAHPDAPLPTAIEPVPAVVAAKPVAAEKVSRFAQPARAKEANVPHSATAAPERRVAKRHAVRRSRHPRPRRPRSPRVAVPAVVAPAPAHVAPPAPAAEFRP